MSPILIPTIKVQLKNHGNAEAIINAGDFNPDEHLHVGEVQSAATDIKVESTGTEGNDAKQQDPTPARGNGRKRLNA